MELRASFREPRAVAALGRTLLSLVPPRPVRFMEVCGTHTVAFHRNGLARFLPPGVRLIAGPGCPVCVTDQATIDLAIAYALEPHTHVVTFGDMLRVPGTGGSLEEARARGGKVTVVTSAEDAIALARSMPATTIVFLAIGFETTAPGVALLAKRVRAERVDNVVILCALKVVPPVMEILAGARDLAIDGFLCPGHVSAVLGSDAYDPLCRTFARPCVIAGFEPVDMLLAIAMLLRQIADGRAEVENEYARVVTASGNRPAQKLLSEVFETVPAPWRGLGVIAASGLGLRAAYQDLDVRRRQPLSVPEPEPLVGCRCGEVLRGAIDPEECRLFGAACTPETPVGPCMVSTEGSCAAHLRYRMHPELDGACSTAGEYTEGVRS